MTTPWRDAFALAGDAVYLNHGAFGATPRPVLAAQAALRDQLEAQPADFFARRLPGRLRHAAARLADFVGARAQDLVFVDNATTAASTVLAALELQPGDEVVVTSYGYPAVERAAAFHCARRGARLHRIPLPFPVDSVDALATRLRDGVLASLGPRTRLVILDHISSPTALRLPLETLVGTLRQASVPVLIDGAHAPGQLLLKLESLGADYYTGNAHKWLFAPKGCAFLQVRADRQDGLHPLVLSHGAGQGFLAEFDWVGTRDPTPFLAIEAALDFVAGLGGQEAITRRNRALVEAGAQLLADALELELSGPEALRTTMITLPLPARLADGLAASGALEAGARALSARLWDAHRIELPIFPFDGRLYFRVSAQVYNQLDDYHRLAEALRSL